MRASVKQSFWADFFTTHANEEQKGMCKYDDWREGGKAGNQAIPDPYSVYRKTNYVEIRKNLCYI
jgi:hypothetical protein